MLTFESTVDVYGREDVTEEKRAFVLPYIAVAARSLPFFFFAIFHEEREREKAQ